MNQKFGLGYWSYNRCVSSIQYPAGVGAPLGGVDHARVHARTLKPHRKQVAFGVVRYTITHNLRVGGLKIIITTYPDPTQHDPGLTDYTL